MNCGSSLWVPRTSPSHHWKRSPAIIRVVGVVTQPDRPAGRGGRLQPPAVKAAAMRLGLPVIQPEKIRHPETMAQLQAWTPDLIVVAAFGQILRQEISTWLPMAASMFTDRCCPRWRGAAPIQASILAGGSGDRYHHHENGRRCGYWSDPQSTSHCRFLRKIPPDRYLRKWLHARSRPADRNPAAISQRRTHPHASDRREASPTPPCLKRKMGSWISPGQHSNWNAECVPCIPGLEPVLTGKGPVESTARPCKRGQIPGLGRRSDRRWNPRRGNG